MPQGNRGHIGIKKETTWGERVVGDNDVFLPFVSETLTPDIEDVVSAIQRGERDEPKSYQGQKDIAGDVVVEVHPKSFGHILRSAINIPDPTGTPASSTETIVCDCETEWTSHVETITSLDPNDKKKGSHSSKIQVPEDVDNSEILAFEEVAGTPLDIEAVTQYKFWIKASIVTALGDLIFRMTEKDNGSAAVGENDDVDIPAMLVANTWTEFTIDVTDPSGLTDILTCAIVTGATADLGEFEVRIDHIRIVVAGTATDAKQHVFTPIKTHDEEFNDDCPLRPYTLEVNKDDGLDAFEFMGAVVSKLSLSFSTTDKILKATLGIIAKDFDKIAPTAPGLEGTNPFLWKDAKIFIADKDAAVDITADTHRCNDLESFKVDFDNNCIAKFALNNTAIARKFIFNGYVAIPINFVVDFINHTEFDYFRAGTERQFIIVLDGDIIKADEPAFRYRLRIDLPLVRYTAYPINTGGPGRLAASVVGKAKYSDHADWLYSIQFTIWNKQDDNEYKA